MVVKRYHRDREFRPVGVVMAERFVSEAHVGLSKVHPLDTKHIDKKRGTAIAEGRMRVAPLVVRENHIEEDMYAFLHNNRRFASMEDDIRAVVAKVFSH